MGQQEFIHGLKGLKSSHRGCVATIGAFDGVHRGHMAIIEQLIAKSKDLGLPSTVMVFEPLPNEYFAKQSPPPRLMRLRDKVRVLFSCGVDRVLCLKFDEALRSLTADEYIEKVLIDGLGVKHLIVGDDFRFGCDRSGDFSKLKRSGKALGFAVSDTATYEEAHDRISSSRIRALLQAGDLDFAANLLGSPYCLSGRVFYGNQIGRQLGFPTANIALGVKTPALSGVFAVSVRQIDDKKHASQSDFGSEKGFANGVANGVANIGTRPTIAGDLKPVLEVHLFDVNKDVYGACLEVVFLKKIREEMRFESKEMLKNQIAEDVASAKHFFSEKN